MRNKMQGFNEVNNLDDIIFERRHKAYGAYELRTNYNERLTKAFFIASALSILFVLSLIAMNKYNEKKNDLPLPNAWGHDSITITIDPNIELQNRKVETTNPEKANPVIVKDRDVHEKKKEEKKDTTSGNSRTGDFTGGGNKGDSVNNGGGIILPDTTTKKKTLSEFLLLPQVMPSFPGGQKAFVKYLTKHFSCSNPDLNGNEGKIILRFAVMSDGTIQRIEVLRENVGIDCVEEAKSVLINSPRWNPGLQNNQPVNVLMVLPITIQKS